MTKVRSMSRSSRCLKRGESAAAQEATVVTTGGRASKGDSQLGQRPGGHRRKTKHRHVGRALKGTNVVQGETGVQESRRDGSSGLGAGKGQQPADVTQGATGEALSRLSMAKLSCSSLLNTKLKCRWTRGFIDRTLDLMTLEQKEL